MPVTVSQTHQIPPIWQGWNLVNIANVVGVFANAPLGLEGWNLAAVANIRRID